MANGQKTAAILRRLKQPSTWAGISALLTLFGISVESAQAVANVGAAVAGLGAIVMNEGER